jgi:hypothetical protein
MNLVSHATVGRTQDNRLFVFSILRSQEPYLFSLYSGSLEGDYGAGMFPLHLQQ